MLIIILEGDFMNDLNALAPYTLYKEICEGDYFVDKTIMIEEVLSYLRLISISVSQGRGGLVRPSWHIC